MALLFLLGRLLWLWYMWQLSIDLNSQEPSIIAESDTICFLWKPPGTERSLLETRWFLHVSRVDHVRRQRSAVWGGGEERKGTTRLI